MKILKVLLFAMLTFPLALQAEQQSTVQKIPDKSAQNESVVLRHHIKVKLQPERNTLEVNDIIRLPDNGQSAFTFHLNSLFHLRYKKRPLHPIRTVDGVSSYHIAAGATRELVLSYRGILESTSECVWLKQSCAMLDETGVFLDANSHWYPTIDGARHRFQMEITLPKKWVSLSQGKQTENGWQEDNPQHSIYLVAGKFKVYESQPDPARPKAMVYLQRDDPKLAQRYLRATHHYLAQYSKLLGEYPYAKFATLESFWETGWGMPSFTMLGSRVMRLPFILHSSFPHEILHNWWGNGVYVDSRAGNWSEGLTAYLADHYNLDSRSERVAYRRDTLQKYQVYTANGEDFPLRNFHSRHDRTTQAIGYGKALMLFHMLRKRLGNKQFFTGLKAFYQQYRFRSASFDQLQQVFAQHSQQKLDVFFQQWRDQPGAPRLEVADYELLPQQGNALTVKLTLQQTQATPAGKGFILDVPIKVQDASGHFNHQTLHMDQVEQQYTLNLKKSARRLLIDPYFDVLRIPDRREVPAVLNALFSRQGKTFVLAENLPQELEAAWRLFFERFSGGKGHRLLPHNDKTTVRAEVLIILGANSKIISKLSSRPQLMREVEKYLFGHENHDFNQDFWALTFSHKTQQIVLLGAGTPHAVEQIARKIPHYGKYSYIAFEGKTGRNIAKDQWQITDSPMTLELKTADQ